MPNNRLPQLPVCLTWSDMYGRRLWDETAMVEYALAAVAANGATTPASTPEAVHTDDDAVDRFAAVMKEKMGDARAKGRSGWRQCDPAALSNMLREHVEKGDPRDVANFCMMLWQLGHEIAASTSSADEIPNATKLRIGTSIRFTKTLREGATGDHPALLYAEAGESGEITGYNEFEGYMVKTDAWPNAFGARHSEFEVATPLPRTSDAAPMPDPQELLEIARATGLRSFLHGVNAENAREILEAYQIAVDARRAAIAAPQSVAQTEPALTYPAEFTEDLQWILGLICFQCIQYAQTLRKAGREIPTKAEAEQAATLDWMLRHYLRDPKDWRTTAAAEMRAMNADASGKEQEVGS